MRTRLITATVERAIEEQRLVGADMIPIRTHRITRLCLWAIFSPLILRCFTSVGIAAEPQQTVSEFDAARLQAGRFLYRDTKNGREIGRFWLTVRRVAENRFLFVGDAIGFDQHWESVATSSFRPINAVLQLKRKNGEAYSMTLDYAPGKVSGKVTVGATAATRTIGDTIQEDTIDQRIDWASMLARDWDKPDVVRFSVYDPESGTSRVEAKAGASSVRNSPLDTVAAISVIYRIQKGGRTESYEIEMTKRIPRILLREIFPNGVVSELAEIHDNIE